MGHIVANKKNYFIRMQYNIYGKHIDRFMIIIHYNNYKKNILQ